MIAKINRWDERPRVRDSRALFSKALKILAGISKRGDCLEIVTIILTGAPYGDEKVWNALRLAKALISASIRAKVNIFLLGDAVVTAKKGQKTPEGYPNLEKMLWELCEQGVEIVACSTCTSARGLTENDMAECVQIGTIMQLAHWVKESKVILTF